MEVPNRVIKTLRVWKPVVAGTGVTQNRTGPGSIRAGTRYDVQGNGQD